MDSFHRNKSKILLSVFLIFGFVLRFHGLDRFSIAGDEKYSLFVSQFTSYQGNNQKDSIRKPDSAYFTAKEFWSEKGIEGFYDAIARVDTGNGAFFTYSLHWWTRMFGLSDGSLRMLPLLFSLGLVLLLYFFVKEHFDDENLALWTAGLAAISPFLISYAQVARNYAILFFFGLLATHYFLRLLRSEFRTSKWWLNVFLYGLCVGICELNHLSAFPLFFIHFIYLLIYNRSWKTFFGFSFAMVLPFLMVVAWLLCPGGAYAFEYIENSVRVYNEMAENSPSEFLSKFSIKTFGLQIRHVISAYFINIDGAYDAILGKKNGLLALALTVIALLVYQIKRLRNEFKILLSVSLLAIYISLVNFSSIASFVFSLNLVFLVSGLFLYWKSLKKKKAKKKRPAFGLLLLTCFLPYFFLMLFAFKDGNTFRVITRYVGYAYPFALILVPLLYRFLWNKNAAWKPWLYVAICIQAGMLAINISDIYKDQQPRYFSNYEKPRIANPYPGIAKQIIEKAMVGDTVVFPTDNLKYDDRISFVSVIDAQLVNFYMPKNNEVIQTVNAEETNKVILKKSTGEEIELFNFDGNQYRY